MNLEILQMQNKPFQTWTASDVGSWLTFLGLGEYKPVFESNLVSGAELEDLTEEDLGVMGILKLGHRKRILKKIQSLKKAGGSPWDTNSADSCDSTNSSHSDISLGSYHSTDSTSSNNSEGRSQLPTKFAVKCAYNGEIRAFFLKNISFKELNRVVQKEYGKKFRYKLREPNGELLTIRSDEDLAECFRVSDTKCSIKLELVRRVEGLGKNETSLLEDLVDGVVVSDVKGKIIYMNRSAERLFGHQRNDILKKDVNVLMPESVARKHKRFIKNYLETNQKKVIGIGREVVGKTRIGDEIPLWLSIAETKGRGFTATFRKLDGGPVSNSSSSSSSSSPSQGSSTVDNNNNNPVASSLFQPLDNILDMAVVINEKGTVIYCNKSVTTQLSYHSQEVIGKNIKMLMPSPFSEEHDGYLKTYLSSGKARVIGKGREVVARAKDGSLARVFLAVTEQTTNGTRMFTGVMRRIDEDEENAPQRKPEKTFLQQEREVLEHLLIPAVVVDEKGLINIFNPAAQKLFNYTWTELLGKNIKVLMSDIDRDKHDEYMRQYFLSDENRKRTSRIVGQTRQVLAQHKDGSILNVKLSVTVRQDGTKTYFTGLFHPLD